MKLTVLERIMLANILPVQGSFTNLKFLRVAREDLSFSEKENKRLNLRQEGEQLFWDEPNPSLQYIKDVKLGEIVTEMIKKALLEKDEKEELSADLFTLYEKFVT
jgi:hypothetical protein